MTGVPAVDPRTVVLTAGRRTPVGTAGHGLAAVDVIGLAAPVLAAVADAVAPAGRPVDEVLLGNCLGPGGDVARVAALAAGLGEDVPGVTVDRQCGSGLEAIRLASALVRAGDADLVLAGGVESASTAPWRYWPPERADGAAAGPEAARRYTRAPFAPAGFPDPDMGVAADDLAAARGIDRGRQDAWAARSHALTIAAVGDGLFDDEIVPVAGVRRDERPRPGLDGTRLARLRPAFPRADGIAPTATAGNSCGISDGAAVVAVTTAAVATAAGLPSVQVVGGAVAAADPALPGAVPARAVRRLLTRHGLSVDDVAAVEVTEAFASVVLAAVDELGLDSARVCAEGGAIALGHPWGASGALLVLRLLSRLTRPGAPEARPGAFGLAVCAIGGGQAVALLVRVAPGGEAGR